MPEFGVPAGMSVLAGEQEDDQGQAQDASDPRGAERQLSSVSRRSFLGSCAPRPVQDHVEERARHQRLEPGQPAAREAIKKS